MSEPLRRALGREEDPLAALLSPLLDPLFRPPGTPPGETAGDEAEGHVPLAHWLVRAAAPRFLVAVGRGSAAAYGAYCEAVLAERLDTRCYFVDGDAGQPIGSPSADWGFAPAPAHAARYGGFSTLLPGGSATALAALADASIDLLYLDATGGTALLQEIERWHPKLSPRAVLLLQGIDATAAAPAPIRPVWMALAARHPSFEFPHAGSVGLLAPGGEPPAVVMALCGLRDAGAVAALRARFAALGARWGLAGRLVRLEARLAQLTAQLATLTAAGSGDEWRAERTRLQQALDAAEQGRARFRMDLAEARFAAARQEQALEAMEARARAAEAAAEAAVEAAAAEGAAARAAEAALRAAVGELELRVATAEAARLASAAAEQAATERATAAAAQAMAAAARVAEAEAEIAAAAAERAVIQASTAWRVLGLARRAGRLLPAPGRRLARRSLRLLLRREPAAAAAGVGGISPGSGLALPGFGSGNAGSGAEPGPAEPVGSASLAESRSDGGMPVSAAPLPPAPPDASAAEPGHACEAASSTSIALLPAGVDAPPEWAPPSAAAPDGDVPRDDPRADSVAPVSPTAAPGGETTRMGAGREGQVADAGAAARAKVRRRILFISGEPHTPGTEYRVRRYAATAAALGWEAACSDLLPVGPHTLAGSDIVVLWRVPWGQHVKGIFEVCEAIGATTVLDIDDLMFKPELARVEVIDGIRSQRFSEEETRILFEQVQRAVLRADIVTCTTAEIATHAREIGKVAFVLPNGFDEATHAAARLAVRVRRQGEGSDGAGGSAGDGLVRIGYAGGSRTHQADFRLAAPALAAVLRDRPEARLVLFRDPRSGEGVVLLHEYPELVALAAQVEWRDMVPLAELPREMARFDVNLAPLEVGNPFCEAKSELKYFEAALVDVPTIASPTGPYRRAITEGSTGCLAADEAGWRSALLRLIDDRELRRRLGRAAYHDALWRFGPHHRAEALATLLGQIGGDRSCGGGREGARAFDLDRRRGTHPPLGAPHVPASEVLFAADALRPSEVTVVVPVYNYADYVLEALESARAQTLAALDLVVVDDRSTDDSLPTVLAWAQAHADRFNRIVVLRNRVNCGLGFTRNVAFDAAETRFVLPLDADNRLRPECCARLAARLRETDAGFAYPAIRHFGLDTEVIGEAPFSAQRLVGGNYIDAMAMVAKWAWAGAGGYADFRSGWEDYDFWCRMVEQGIWGVQVPEVLADYRVHRASMLHTTTDSRETKRQLMQDFCARHPWLDVARLPVR